MDRRLARDYPCDRRPLAAIGPGLDVMGALPSRTEIDDDAAIIAHHSAIDAHILHAGVMVARNDDRRDVGRLVLARRPGDDRELAEACGVAEQFDLVAYAVWRCARLRRIAQGRNDLLVDLIDLALQSKRYAARRRAE